MNFKTTLILLVLIVAVAVWLLVDRETTTSTPQQTNTATTDSSAGKPLFDVNASDVQSISITPANGSKIVFNRSGGDWNISKPVKAAAQSWQVDALVRGIIELKTRGAIAAGIDTGLEHPRYQVQLTTDKGKPIQLAVGDKTAIGDAMYVRVGDDKQAQIVPSGAWADLSRPLSDYRDKSLVKVSSQQINQLTIRRPGHPEIKLVREGTQWKMTLPQVMPVDASAASDLAFAIAGAQVKDFLLPDQISPAVTQLNHPQLTLWYSTEPPSTQPATQPAGTTLLVGGYDSVLKENLFAQVEGNAEVVKIPATLLGSFSKSPLELRDKVVLDLTPENIEAVTLTIDHAATTRPTTRPASKTTITLTRRPVTPEVAGPALPASRPATAASTRPATEPAPEPQTQWLVGGTHTGDANDADVAALLEKLHPLRAEKFLEPPAADLPHPLTQYTLTLKTHDGTTRTLNLRDTGPDGELTGQLGDLHFELDRTLITALDAEFAR